MSGCFPYECTCVCHVSRNDCCERCGPISMCEHLRPKKDGCLECEKEELAMKNYDNDPLIQLQLDNLKYCQKCCVELIDSLQLRVKELERFQDITHEQYKNICRNGSPYKCPVCEGKVFSEIKITKTESGNDKLNFECHGCQGTGVVWG